MQVVSVDASLLSPSAHFPPASGIRIFLMPKKMKNSHIMCTLSKVMRAGSAIVNALVH